MEFINPLGMIVTMLQKIVTISSSLSKTSDAKKQDLASYVGDAIDGYRQLYGMLSELRGDEDLNKTRLDYDYDKKSVISRRYEKMNQKSFDMDKYFEITQQILFVQENLDKAINKSLGKSDLSEMQRLKLTNVWVEIVQGMSPDIFDDQILDEFLLNLSEILVNLIYPFCIMEKILKYNINC